jgi:LCP family protein required for cell wall assembly
MARHPDRGSVAGGHRPPGAPTPRRDGGQGSGGIFIEPQPPISPPAAPVPGAPRRRRRRRKRSVGERVLRWGVVLVAVALVVLGSAYGYVRYRLGQIASKPCKTCAVAPADAPYNVLLVGSDTRVGNTGQAAKSFGSSSLVTGQRSDTIKIIHIDPAAGSARLLSIPRDTYVTLSGLSSASGFAKNNKINTAFNEGTDPLIQTIENTFGIPVNHFVILDFNGVIDLVNSVGGIRLNFPYPVRDNDNGNNNSGLLVKNPGCQTLNGNTALALARSRFFQYEVRPGVWYYDGSGDLGRIQRQNTVIQSVINTAKSSYNPLTINAFLGTIVHDITKDDGMSTTAILSLVQRYHAFSGSQLQTFTLPTLGAYSGVAGAVEVVQEPQAQQVISQFLGTAPNAVETPPLNAYGSPVTVPATTTTPATVPPARSQASPVTTTTVPGSGPFNPTPC